jgi:hypothetical protein
MLDSRLLGEGRRLRVPRGWSATEDGGFSVRAECTGMPDVRS